MTNFLHPRGLRILAGMSLLAVVSLAQAQYVWVDSKGVRQFSDRPPPPDVPMSKILKAPNMPKAKLIIPDEAPAPAAAADAPVASADAKAKAPPTLAEKEMEYKKRQKEKEEAQKKLTSENEQRRMKEENCASNRAAKAQVESGERVRNPDVNGERSYMSDEERAAFVDKANKALAGCK